MFGKKRAELVGDVVGQIAAEMVADLEANRPEEAAAKVPTAWAVLDRVPFGGGPQMAVQTLRAWLNARQLAVETEVDTSEIDAQIMAWTLICMTNPKAVKLAPDLRRLYDELAPH